MVTAHQPNPFIGINYIPDNPKMAEPPPYWLARLYDFDADLVVIPSRTVPFSYVLARRCRQSKGIADFIITDPQNDTAMCAKYRVVPVCRIFRHSTASWSIDNILLDLASRDTWRLGGGDKAADAIEAHEAVQEKKRQAVIRDDMWMRSGDAWRSYQARTGQRVSLANVPQLHRSVTNAPTATAQ